MRVSVTSSIRYVVQINGVLVSSHTQERESVEAALNAVFQNAPSKVEVTASGKTVLP